MEQKNLEKGKVGELKVIEKLTNRGIQVKDYTDYDQHKYKQKKGYDIEILNTVTGEWDRVDIKSNCKNEYIYLETQNDTKEKLGWFWTSSSDLIYHYDLTTDDIYGYELKQMRNFVYKYDIKPEHGKFKNLIGLNVTENKIIKVLYENEKITT